jgi:phosphoribosylcarboxyaminoimidazole (NCAIR) mutase
MSEIKPVAWMYVRSPEQVPIVSVKPLARPPAGWDIVPLIQALPSTHRIVSVELLESYQAAIRAAQFMGFDAKYEQMQNIIDGETEQ